MKFIDSTSGSNYYGGGLYIRDGSHVSLEQCEFERNQSPGGFGRGGAVYIDDGSVVEITATTFKDNEANTGEYSGGGIWVHSDYVTLLCCKFENNTPNDLTRNGGTIDVSPCTGGYHGSSGAELTTYGEITGSLLSYDCLACEKGKTTAVGGER